MNTASSTSSNGSSDPSATPHHRRSREEVEALAKNFVGTPTAEEALAIKRPPPKALLAGLGAVVVIALAVVLWPKGGSEAERTQAESNRAAAAAAEAEQYRQRFEAERERKRKEMASGKEYLERMAAADAALMKDFGEQATRLAQRAAAAPAAGDAPPTPRDVKPAPAKTTPAPNPAPTQSAATPGSTPAKPAPTPAPAPAAEQQAAQAAPAQTAPQQVAQLDKSQCTIHVSELSKSGKLTYDDVKRMKGARVDADSGNVFTPPVQVNGRNVVFEVMPTGCVRMVRR